MSADTGAVDAAVIDIMAVAMKGTILGGGEEAWEVIVAKYPTVAESYREMARAAYAAFQRANAERVTALVDAFHDAAMEYGQETIIADLPRAETGAEEAASKKADDARAALLLAVVGPSEVQG